MNFTKNTCFEIQITKIDFERKFKQNVEFEKIHFFTPPLLKKDNNGGYKGEIFENSFKLKKVTSFKPNLNFETSYGEIIDMNEKVILKIQTKGIQGMSLYSFLLFLTPGAIFLFNVLITENYKQFDALFIYVSLLIIFYYFIYKIIVSRIAIDVSETNENLEKDIRSWMSI